MIKRFIIVLLLAIPQLYYLSTGLTDHSGKDLNKKCLELPLYNSDYPELFTYAQDSSHFLTEYGHKWGYNPFYLAGYPSGIYLGVDTHPATLILSLSHLFFEQSDSLDAKLFNFTVFVFFLLCPIIIYFSCINFAFTTLTTTFVTSGALISFWSMNYIRSQQSWGVYCFILACHLSILSASYVYKISNIKNLKQSLLKNILPLAIIGILSFIVHPLASVLTTITCLPIGLLCVKRIHRRVFWCAIGIILLATLIANLFWIYPYLSWYKIHTSWAHAEQTSLAWIKDHLSLYPGNIFSYIWFLLAVGLGYFYKFTKLQLSFLISSICFLVLFLFGSQVGFANMQPTRFITPFALLTLLLLGSFIKNNVKLAGIGFASVLFLFSIYSTKSPQYSCGFDDEIIDNISNFLEGRATSQERVLFQQSLDAVYSGGRPVGLFSKYFKGSTLSHPFVFPPIKQSFLQFTDKGLPFGISDLNSAKDINTLETYLQLYGVKYIVLFREDSLKQFLGTGLFNQIWISPKEKLDYQEIGIIDTVYSVIEFKRSQSSLCVDCQANITYDYNSLKINNAPAGSFTIKFHYLKGLVSKNKEVTITAREDLGKFPLIQVNNPKGLSQFELVYEY